MNTQNLFPGLRDSLETFLAEHSNEEALPAVDIGSGEPAGVVEPALLCCRKRAMSSEWYPTDWAGPPGESETGGPLEIETSAALRHCVERAARNKEITPLFQDESEEPVVKGDDVLISGLQKATQLNGKPSFVQSPDPKKPGRYGVQLSRDSSNVKSLKQENLSYGGAVSLADATTHAPIGGTGNCLFRRLASALSGSRRSEAQNLVKS